MLDDRPLISLTPLTPRQARFAAEYLVDLNATQAAIRAGYSPKTATEMACENLTKPHIAAAIAAGQAEHARRTEITVERVLLEYAKIAFAANGDFGGQQLKPADKLHALDSVAKHLGMFTERHEVTGKDGAPLAAADPSKIALVLLTILSRARPEREDDAG